MSASDKKKLRKEQNAAAMTEKQKKEQQETKKLKAYTLTFAIVMVLVVAIVVGVIVGPMIDGAVRRGSNAVTIGEHKLSTAELTYFYYDAISEYQQNVYNQYYSSFGDYWSLMLGFDTAKPLDEQIQDEESGKNWAEYFIDSAIDTARDTYALYDDALLNEHKMTEDEQETMDSYIDTLSVYATYYGYSSVDSYLRSSYGNGATEKGYKEYYRVCSLASSYITKYADDLKYEADDYRAYEKDKFDDYSSVSYVYHTMKYNSYLGEGTKSEDGKTTTWTDAEKDAARQALKADVEAILAGSVTDKEAFDKAIQGLAINKVDESDKDATKPTATEVKNTFFERVTLQEDAAAWLKSTDRKAGDLKSFEMYTYAAHEDPEHEHSEDCGCTRTVDGYTIVLFTERNDNAINMVNVRHILVKFEGGTKDSNGNTTYSDAEKNAAKTAAEALLKKWEEGAKTEESFGELANKESDDQSGQVTNGGLYEDVYPGQMVTNFNDWCFDKDRKPGDTGIVETEYGYHVMYFSSTDEMTYRDKMIDTDMRIEDTEEWQEKLSEAAPMTIVSLKLMDYGYVMQQ